VALRQDPAQRGVPSTSRVAAQFLKTTPASTFYRGDAPPGGER
jgi:hypothetical protein